MGLIQKQLDFEIKQLGEEKERMLRFIGSTEDIDRDGDIIEVAGWITNNYMKNPVVLWAHNSYSTPVIGRTINIEKDVANKKLIFDIKFPTLDEMATDVENPAEHAKFVDMIYNLCKNGYLNATSVGFRGIKYKTRDDADVLEKPEWQRGKRYMEQELHEISIVNIPANQNALIEARGKGLIDDTTIKSFFNAKKDQEELKEDTKLLGEKAGARFSKETLEACNDIVTKMQTALDSHSKAHKEAMKAYKGCMDEWHSLMGTSGNVAEDDDAEEISNNEMPTPKSFEGILLKFGNEIFEKIDSLENKINQAKEGSKDANKGNGIVIDLAAIEIPDTKKDAKQNELPFEPEEFSKMLSEVIEQKIKTITGKV